MKNVTPKTAAVISYITWIGWIFALLMLEDKEDEFIRVHLNQALCINLLGLVPTVLVFVPFAGAAVGSLCSLVCLVGWILGIVNAARGTSKPLPVIGSIRLI